MTAKNPPALHAPLLLIDGYNLWWNTGEFGLDNEDGTLAGARDSLIQWLLTSLSSDLVKKTVLVFDAKNPPANRACLFDCQELTVHFAVDYPDADTLMEDYIDVHHAPRNLTVVSSDHRIQRAAKRRRATAMDADRWARQIQSQVQSRRDRQNDSAKSNPALSEHEVVGWMKSFGLENQHDSKQLEQEIKRQLKQEHQGRQGSPERRKK